MWMFTAALAAPALNVVQSGDAVTVTTVVPAPVADVQAFLRDPRWLVEASKAGQLAFTPRADGCFDQRFSASYGIMAVGYTALTCPTDTGAKTTLVSSDSFSDLAIGWDARPSASGTQISYTYRAVMDVPIPSWVIRRFARSESEDIVGKLVARFSTP